MMGDDGLGAAMSLASARDAYKPELKEALQRIERPEMYVTTLARALELHLAKEERL